MNDRQTTRRRRSYLALTTSPDVLAVLLLVGLSLGFCGAFLLLGLTFHEDDLENFYYPVLLYLVQSLRQGVLPLWAPEMFAGFPYLADGSNGTLYPLTWLALLLPPETLSMWLIATRSALASVFMYAFVRAVGMSVLASLLAAVVYAFSGYSVGHWIHLSIGHSALTLPLGLFALAKAHLARGRQAVLWLLLAALAVGLLWLGLHPQVALIGTLALALFGAFREVAGEEGRPWRWRLARLAGGSVLAALLAAGLAAGQLLPMLELGSFSARGQGIPYEFAATYALPPHNLATFFWPYAFVTPGGFDWGLTNRWETALHVGTPTLVLAGLAVTGRRDRHVLFWAGLAVLSLWIACGPYTPLNLHYLVFQLPPFAIFRVPARFVQLTDLGLAVLAGYGLDLLRQPGAVTELGRWAGRFAAVLLVTAGLGAAAVAWVALWPDLLAPLLQPLYLSWSRAAGWRAEQIWPAVQATWHVANPRWLVAMALLLGGAAATLAWRRWPGLGSWPGLFAALITVDLLLFAVPFWHSGPLAVLARPNAPTVQYVLERAGADRVLSLPGSHSEPNRLIPYGVRDVNTYGPLSTQRHQEYLALARRWDNRLLDLLGVRWLLAPLAEKLPRESEGVRFDPRLPLAVVSSCSSAPPPAFILAAPFPTQAVRLVGRVSGATPLAVGQVVAEVVLRSPDGRSLALPLQAGVHLAKREVEPVDPAATPAHRTCHVDVPQPSLGVASREGDGLAGSGEVLLPGAPFPAGELAFRRVAADVQVEVFGVSLVGPDGELLPSDRLTDSRFVEHLRDDTTRVLENRDVLPRVFLAGRAQVLAPDAELLYAVADELADPMALVYLEEPVDPALLAASGTPGTARILAEAPTQLAVAVQAERTALLFVADPYYPGWQAAIDGQPAPILRADYLFRAVVVPPGSHLVTMTFEPASVRLGLTLSALTIALMVGLAVWLRLPRRSPD